jgi:hypothetical protein
MSEKPILALVGQPRQLRAGEVILGERQVLHIGVGETALETAKACLNALVELYDVATAERALRMAIRKRPGQNSGRRSRSESQLLDDILLSAFDQAELRGSKPSAAIEYVVAKFGDEKTDLVEGLIGKRLKPDSIRRRLKASRTARSNAPTGGI